MLLEEILKPQKLNKGKHDTLILKVESAITLSPNVMSMYKSAYFKHNGVEGDFDYLAMFYDSKIHDIEHWKEVPFADSTLLIFEMKSNDTSSNYHKAQRQLKKEKNFILNNTDYRSIDCFYSFNVGNSYMFRHEQID